MKAVHNILLGFCVMFLSKRWVWLVVFCDNNGNFAYEETICNWHAESTPTNVKHLCRICIMLKCWNVLKASLLYRKLFSYLHFSCTHITHKHKFLKLLGLEDFYIVQNVSIYNKKTFVKLKYKNMVNLIFDLFLQIFLFKKRLSFITLKFF